MGFYQFEEDEEEEEETEGRLNQNLASFLLILKTYKCLQGLPVI